MTSTQADFPQTERVVSSLVVLDQATSTNTVVRVARPPLAAFSVVVTTNQVEGRGRLGREWLGSPGDMLAASVVLPAGDLSTHSLSPLLVGACLHRALLEHGVEHAELKWPNDILVEGRKLAGILCEVRDDGAVIAGVGLNLQFSGEPPAPLAVALAECGVDPALVADPILASLVSLLRQWGEESAGDQLSFVREAMSTLGLFVEVFLADGKSWRGIAQDITPEGHLVVSSGAGGSLTTVVAADIEHLYQ